MGRGTAKGVRPCTKTGLHDRRVGFPMPLGNALRPQARGVRAFRPAPTPNWAFAAGTRGFTAMPFKGFLGPSSEAADLTRILRRRSAGIVYHIRFEYSRDYTSFSIYLHCIHDKPETRSFQSRKKRVLHFISSDTPPPCPYRPCSSPASPSPQRGRA